VANAVRDCPSRKDRKETPGVEREVAEARQMANNREKKPGCEQDAGYAEGERQPGLGSQDETKLERQ